MPADHETDLRTAAGVGEHEELKAMGDRLVAEARPGERIEVTLSRGASTIVRVHDGEVESLTSAGSAGAGIRVIREGRLGFAHCGSLDADVLADTLAEARDNTRFAEADENQAIAEPDGVEIVAQDMWHDEVIGLAVQDKVALALELERLVTGRDPRVGSARVTTYGDGWGQNALVSTAGIRVGSEGTSCSVGTQPLARDGEETQIGWGSDAARVPETLDLERVASEAVQRAVRLLGAGKPASARLTVVLEPRLAITLLGIVAGMLSAEPVQKGRSPFADRLGDQIASPLVNLVDDPTRSDSLAAEENDGEGLACRANPLLSAGVLQRFLYDATTASRAGTASTGSAVRSARGLPMPGPQLLVLEPGTTSVEGWLRSQPVALAVESFSGLHSGVNPVSGDFSVGAEGVMIRGGEAAEPVREVTLASTLQRLLLGVVAVGDDFEWLPSGNGAPTICIEDVSMSGM
jgi:PmbA protein